ncbi:MAG: hypothetical protein Q8Q00_04820 [Dehalococcoidia bacterium]|nr:hypothetical protein [Dehalococcoidia bacterium]
MTFGQYLRHLRFMRKLPLNELVTTTGLDPTHLVDLETDHAAPTQKDIAKLAAGLSVTEEALLEEARHAGPGVL